MPRDGAARAIERLVRGYGYTIADQLRLAPLKADGRELFEVFCASMLSARRVDQWTALTAWVEMKERGWATPDALSIAPWKQRVRVLTDAGCTRSPERLALSLGAVADVIGTRYDGDLGNLREAAGKVPATERRLLNDIKSVSDPVVDVFFREVQLVWDELYPYADERVLEAAERLGLPSTARALSELTSRESFPRLVAALAHVGRVDAFHALSEDGSARISDLTSYGGRRAALRGAS
jgi:hypothetical protein